MMSKVQECRAALIEALAEEREKIDLEIMALGGTSTCVKANGDIVSVSSQELPLNSPPTPRERKAMRAVTVGMKVGASLKAAKDADSLLSYVRAHPGCSGTEINKALGINAAQAMRLRAELGRKLKMTGKKRGARYSVRGGA